jgi:hypothetical protein
VQQTLTVGAELLVSLISAGAAIASALVAAFLSARASARQSQLQAEIEQQQALRRKLEERADVMSQVRDPLLWAAFDLQSRVYNIVTRQFLSVYQQSGAAEHKAYAQRNTLFLFAQYFAWVEIIRRRVQFLDLGSAQENREIVNHLSGISGVLTSRNFPDLLFLVFRGDQRAIGEIMIEPKFSAELGCLGYAAFCTRLDTERSFAAWFKPLLRDIDELVADEAPRPRLTTLQHRLIDLINFLDPDSIRFPDWHRDKVLPTMPACRVVPPQ